MSEVICNCLNPIYCRCAKPVIPAPPLPCACGKPVKCYQSKPCTNLAGVPLGGSLFLGAKDIRSETALIEYLLNCGGAIVNANTCSAYEIATARAEGRIYISPSGAGLILLDAEWLNEVRRLEALQDN